MAWAMREFEDRIIVLKIGEPDTKSRLIEVGKQIGVQPALEAGKKGSTDEGDNIYEYDVSHLYKIYKFVRDNYDRL